jgi:NAD(P)-dependent dehydrogenase (short-subunit alcohol dehydrogenase family)
MNTPSGNSTQARIALVTGANRGIGFEVCHQLARAGNKVILTARNADAGERAAASLRQEGLNVVFCPLDVTDAQSVTAARQWVEREFGRLDILVNNAGVDLDDGVSVFDVSPALVQQTFDTNTIGPLRMCQAFVPLMRQHNYGRVVNVSSGSGQLTDMGGYTAAYAMSKTALNALTRIVAAEVSAYNIKVNSVCPGWVRTDMGGPNAPRSVEQGADGIVWLATLPDDGPSGGFFRDRKPVSW